MNLNKSMQKRLNLESFTLDIVGTPGLRLKTLDRNPKILQVIFKRDEQMPLRDDVLLGLKEERGYSLLGKTLGDSIWEDFADINSGVHNSVGGDNQMLIDNKVTFS